MRHALFVQAQALEVKRERQFHVPWWFIQMLGAWCIVRCFGATELGVLCVAERTGCKMFPLRKIIVRRGFVIGLVVVRPRIIAFQADTDEAALLVEEPLPLFPGFGLIVRGAALVGALPAMVLSATEGAA